MPVSIETTELTKRFPKGSGYKELIMPWKRTYKTALDHINLRIETGEVFGLLGTNGAGKTTLLKTLATLLLPDEGQVMVQGWDVARHPEKVKPLLGYVVSDERSFFWRLTARQNLRFFSQMNEIPRREIDSYVENLLSLVDLKDVADERVMRFSTGMKHRLAIARGLIADPSILLLDEPTRSLDPHSTRTVWDLIKEELVGRLGKTVVIATHDMEEATHLCDRVAIINQGKIKACDTVTALRAAFSGTVHCFISVRGISPQTATEVSEIKGVQSFSVISPNGHPEYSLELTLDDPSVQVPAIVDHLVAAGGRVLRVNQEPRSLSEVVMAMTEVS